MEIDDKYYLEFYDICNTINKNYKYSRQSRGSKIKICYTNYYGNYDNEYNHIIMCELILHHTKIDKFIKNISLKLTKKYNFKLKLYNSFKKQYVINIIAILYPYIYYTHADFNIIFSCY